MPKIPGQKARWSDAQKRLTTLACMAISLGGCAEGDSGWSGLFGKKPHTVVDTSLEVDPITRSASYRDTIGEQAFVDGMRRLRVRGYGLVVGLGRNGSTRCPTRVREQLLEEIYKTREFATSRHSPVTPEELVDDSDTAVVAIEGEIPALAPAGTRFDIIVRAIPGTDTVSLAGGWLFPCNLQIFRTVAPGAWIPGQTVATGAGPIFINPFARAERSATQANLRQGLVIGGGVNAVDRRIRLLLTTPSYRQALAITQRINERFGDAAFKIADAVSPGQVKVTVPPAHRNDPKHFLSLVQHLYLPTHGGFRDRRLHELIREFTEVDAPHVEIAAAWEAMGRTILPQIRPFYSHPREECSFFAAVAGVRIGDELAIEPLEKHLFNPDGPFRQAAIRVLAAIPGNARAGRLLRRVLSDADPRIRVAAYEALRDRNDSSIRTEEVGSSGFTIDIVPCDGERLIFAARRDRPRIALFGGESIRCTPPLFLDLPDGMLTVAAAADADSLTLVRRSRFSATVSDPITTNLGVRELITLLGSDPPRSPGEQVRGLGLDYSTIVFLLDELCRTESINAKFMLGQPAHAVPLSAVAPGRPESDL